MRGRARSLVVRRRHVGLSSDDVLFASYPKSGSTWLRFVLTHALTGEDIDFDLVPTLSPPLGKQKDGPTIVPGGGRLVKSHEHPLLWPGASRRPRVILLVRDCRDVCVSYFYHWVKYGGIRDDFEAYFAGFLRGTAGPFGSWWAHTDAWLRFRDKHPGTVHIVRYETALTDPESTLLSLSADVGLGLSRESIVESLVGSTPERMRAKESSSQKLGAITKREGAIGFVRAASGGGWQEALTSGQIKRLEAVAGEQMEALGYRLSTGATRDHD